MKFCKDCIHALPWRGMLNPFGADYSLGKCTRKVSLASGLPDESTYCVNERDYGECGAAAKYFEAKPVGFWKRLLT